MSQGFGQGLIYAGLVVLLGVLYWLQQRQIASRTVNPSMSAGQQKLMQYLPVVFAVFQVFFPTGLVLYYLLQTVLRIGQQSYITRRFYKGDESLGSQAQRAGTEARELAKQAKGESSDSGKGGGRAKTSPAVAPNAKAARPTPKNNTARAPRPAPAAKPKSAGRATPPTKKPTPSTDRSARPAAKGGQSASRHPKPKK
jgi:YidC/Oxa1 family membrane protein insertase